MKHNKKIGIIFLLLVFIIYFSDKVNARAGRGQSYRPSSSSSSSYRSSSSSYRSSSYRSSSSSSRSYRSSYSGYHRSSYGSGYRHSGYTKDDEGNALLGLLVFGIIVFAVGYALFWYFRRIGDSHPPVIEPTFDADAEAKMLAKIRESDPNFSMEVFLDRAREIFLRLQDAWSSGDMAPVRNFLSQGVYNRFKIQLEIMRNVEGLKNIMSDVEVLTVNFIGVSANPPFVTIHVSVNAKARDVMLPADAGDDEARRLLSKSSASTFSEVYSFTRKLNAQSDPSRDLLKGQCPRCGFVPDNFAQVNKCPNCGALYNSGEYDWVLSEITQIEEWKAFSAGDVSGLAEGMSSQVIEDRASYLFWRWIQSRVRGSVLPLMRDATEKMKKRLDSMHKEFLGEVAVGAVDLKGVESDNEEYRADLLVQWSASLEKGKEPIHFDHKLYLVLPKGENVETNFADHGCAQCGAPLPDTDSLNCAYCGALLPETNADWLLDEVNEVSRG